MVIRLDVSDAKDAFKLFLLTINNRGLRLSPTDIIKNFLLGNAARFGVDALQAARSTWADLIVHLDGTSADSFFRYYLMALLKTRVTDGEVVAQFKKLFMQGVAEAIELPERHLYADVEVTEERARRMATSKSTTLLRLRRMAVLSSKPFLANCWRAPARTANSFWEGLGKRGLIDLRNLRMIKAVQHMDF